MLRKTFLFTLFNHKQRHAVCRQVHARGRTGTDGTFTKLMALVNDKEFREKVDRAITEPNKPEGRAMVGELQRLITIGGSKIPFSAMERKSAGSQIYNSMSSDNKRTKRV